MYNENINKIKHGITDDSKLEVNGDNLNDIEQDLNEIFNDSRKGLISEHENQVKVSTDGPIGQQRSYASIPLHQMSAVGRTSLRNATPDQEYFTERGISPSKRKDLNKKFSENNNNNNFSQAAKKKKGKKQVEEAGYTSRRLRNYEDDQSQDEDGGQSQGFMTSVGKELQYMNTQGEMVSNKPNPRFKNYSGIFKNLVKNTTVATMYPICTMIITYDSTKAVTVTKRSDKEYYIKQYDLETYEMTFEEMIGGKDEDYIKLKEVEQNSTGKKYAIVYNNDGLFKMRTFEKVTRTKEEIEADEVCFNDLVNLNDYTMCIQTFPDPFVTCTFITDERIYVNFFHNYSLTHYHFIYNTQSRAIEGIPIKIVMKCTKKNFPYKCFYNDELNEVYSFYRQGQSIIVNADNAEKFVYDRMTEMDLGQMCLVYNSALIARSSSDILFFKIEYDEDTEERKWVLYNQIEVRGFIYYIKGNVRIQITTDEKIFFYLIDKDTLEAILENVMFNFMSCNQMMFGSKVRYCVTYKTNQKSFDIYRRKYWHDFKVPLSDENLEGSIALELEKMNAFLVSKIDRIIIYDCHTFAQIGELPISLLKADTREPNQVISMQKSQDEKLLAVISGKFLIKNEQKFNQLFIFKKIPGRRYDEDRVERDRYDLVKRVVLKDIPEFQQVSMNFHFKQSDREVKEILFTKIDRIFSLNFNTSSVRTVYKFRDSFLRQPHSFKPNVDQTVFMIATNDETKYINMGLKMEVDLNAEYYMDVIKEIIYDSEDHHYYILSNKFEEKLGFYVVRINEQDPYQIKYLIKWKNKLDIGDTNIFLLRSLDKGLKELIISYKTIFINTYNVICMDISVDDEQTVIFRHESFQLWESESMGILLTKNKDFVTLNKTGMQSLSLGSNEKRAVKDHNKVDRMMHSLESCNFMKIDPNNYLLFECSQPGKRIISIQQEYTKGDLKQGEEAAFWRLYNVKVYEITLRELLLFQSLYVCKTLTQIVDIVNDQPKPLVFYKSFLELDGANMVSILSFDSRSMEYLLSDDFEEHFSSEFPLFYRNKIQKGHSSEGRYFYRSAIDSSLRNNQVKAVAIIIDYVVKYQNFFVSSFLFQRNFATMIEKGIEIKPLLDSEVFSFSFDLDEWPSNHYNPEELIRPFNENIFQIRKHYRTIFHEDEFCSMDDLEGSMKGRQKVNLSNKVYKISYSINFLPMLGVYIQKNYDPYKEKYIKRLMNEEVNLLSLCVESEELAMFESETLQELIDFKWNATGYALHLFGFCIHCCYISILALYTKEVYIDGKGNDSGEENTLSLALLAGILYPALYETIQMFKNGFLDYITDTGNWIDLVYIGGSIIMSQLHRAEPGPYHFVGKLFMIVVVILAIRRTFTFLRIFRDLSPIVTMLTNVIWDLRIFLCFYVILLTLFSLIYGVIGLGNHKQPGLFRDTFFVIPENGGGTERELSGDTPGIEYYQIGQLFGNIVSTMRVSLGDFGLVGPTIFMDENENIAFWFIWFLTLLMTNIIFLNFIVAEASASYAEVSEQLENYIQLQKADLVSEAESLIPNFGKTLKKFPRYLAIRKVN